MCSRGQVVGTHDSVKLMTKAATDQGRLKQFKSTTVLAAMSSSLLLKAVFLEWHHVTLWGQRSVGYYLITTALRGQGTTVTHHKGQGITVTHHRGQGITVTHHRGQGITVTHHRGQVITVTHHTGQGITVTHHTGQGITVTHHTGQGITVTHHTGQGITVTHHTGQGMTQRRHWTFAKITENLRVRAISQEMNTKRDRKFRKRKMKQKNGTGQK